jgi:hypothetical protein
MTETIVGLMAGAVQANEAVKALLAAGIDRSRIHLVTAGQGGDRNVPDVDPLSGQSATGAIQGAGTGTARGVAAPVAAFTSLGMEEYEAQRFAADVFAGGAAVVVKADEPLVERAVEALRAQGAREIVEPLSMRRDRVERARPDPAHRSGVNPSGYQQEMPASREEVQHGVRAAADPAQAPPLEQSLHSRESRGKFESSKEGAEAVESTREAPERRSAARYSGPERRRRAVPWHGAERRATWAGGDLGKRRS